MTDRRSSSGTHFQRELIAGVDSSHAVRLRGGSTGGIVEAFGADTNISLRVSPKESGLLYLGSTSQSTTGMTGFQRFQLLFTPPDIAASTWVDSTYTLSGATTNATFTVTPRLTLDAGYGIGDVRCSTADELTIRWNNQGASTISGTTNRFNVQMISY